MGNTGSVLSLFPFPKFHYSLQHSELVYESDELGCSTDHEGLEEPEQKQKDEPGTHKKPPRAAKLTTLSSLSIQENESPNAIASGEIVSNRWKIQHFLDSGAFGEVYRAIDIRTKRLVVLKFDIAGKSPSKLRHEYQTYRVLWNTMDRVEGFAQCHDFGEYQGRKYLTCDLLGRSLQSVSDESPHIPGSQVLGIAYQAVGLLRHLHSRNFLHRDIKPSNFVMGRRDRGAQDGGRLYLIDFGLSKRYKYNMSLTHIPYGRNRRLCGTRQYMSINTHMGIEQGRRDDMESLCYMLIYLCNGQLPWTELCKRRGTINLVFRQKRDMSAEQICSGVPRELYKMLNYIRRLGFEDKPDYSGLQKMFLG